LERLVKEKIARGEYDSPDAFVSEAVQRLVDEEKEETATGRDSCPNPSCGSGDRPGRLSEYDKQTIHELAKDVHERGLKKRGG